MMATVTVTAGGAVPGPGGAGVEAITREPAERRGADSRRGRKTRTPGTDDDQDDGPPDPPAPRAAGRLDVLA